MGFPVFARGVIPIPGTKTAIAPLDGPVHCGGVEVRAGDVVVADEEGIVVTPHARAEQTLLDARARLAQEAGETLDAWAEAHRARIDTILSEHDVRD